MQTRVISYCLKYVFLVTLVEDEFLWRQVFSDNCFFLEFVDREYITLSQMSRVTLLAWEAVVQHLRHFSCVNLIVDYRDHPGKVIASWFHVASVCDVDKYGLNKSALLELWQE